MWLAGIPLVGFAAVGEVHIGHDHEGQDAHQHQHHGDGDDGCHHGVVALVRAEHPAQATSDPTRGATHVHDSGEALIHGGQLEVAGGLPVLLLESGQGEAGLGQAGSTRRGLLEDQLALAALEAHGQRPLHLWREFAEDVLVVAQLGQVAAMGQVGELSTHRAGKRLELYGDHVDPGQALQTEGVPAGEQLGGFKDVVVFAEANHALSVLHVIFLGVKLLPVAVISIPVLPPVLLASTTLPPRPFVSLSLPPSPRSPSSFGVSAHGPTHLGGFLLFLLLDAVFTVRFGFDVGRLFGPAASIGTLSFPVFTHGGQSQAEVLW